VQTKVTSTPSASTETDYVTSTAYLDDEGNTIAIMKRDAMPTGAPDLAKRATKAAKPYFMASYSNADLKVACMCLNLVRPTSTKVTVATSTGAFLPVYFLGFLLSSLPALSVKNIVKTVKKVVVLPTPVATVSATSGTSRSFQLPVLY
jgi:hypothetical protein